MRRNLIVKLEEGEDVFPGIVGFDETVIPQVENAILAGQDIILLGERGQAKSRIIRMLTSLLDEWTPVIEGAEIPENPFAPITAQGREIVTKDGEDTAINWLHRDARYGEKLATPDITIADLIGEVDPIKIAEGRYLSDELTIHYGLIPRTNRGIFSINELPDLAERIQVGMFNLMEERDVQIKGYRVRLPLDIIVVASANPEDYTNRGRIITPLKDRYGAQIRTHYPKDTSLEIAIMEMERTQFSDTEGRVVIPHFMKEVVGEYTSLARKHPEINQRSGVSVRVSIANYETIVANSLRRAIFQGEEHAVPRLTDLPFMMASTLGKIEMETMEDGRETKIHDDLIKRSVLNVFDRYFTASEFDGLIESFEQGSTMDTGADFPSNRYTGELEKFSGFKDALGKLEAGKDEPAIASAMEFVLEGLHLNRRLNRDLLEGGFRYHV